MGPAPPGATSRPTTAESCRRAQRAARWAAGTHDVSDCRRPARPRTPAGARTFPNRRQLEPRDVWRPTFLVSNSGELHRSSPLWARRQDRYAAMDMRTCVCVCVSEQRSPACAACSRHVTAPGRRLLASRAPVAGGAPLRTRRALQCVSPCARARLAFVRARCSPRRGHPRVPECGMYRARHSCDLQRRLNSPKLRRMHEHSMPSERHLRRALPRRTDPK